MGTTPLYPIASLFVTLVTALSVFATPDFAIKGYATTSGGTTGGAGGTVKTISTLEELISWGSGREKNSTPEIVTITGKITASGDKTLITIKNGANITIQGSGTTGELSGVGLNIRDYTNVIVKNLKIHEVRYPDDALTLDNVQRAWVDHCELYSTVGEGVSTNTYDGLLDIKNGSSAITVSWCYLHDHIKCSLIGHTDNINALAKDSTIRVTYHHNYFVNTASRNPSIRYGAIHLFNNYFGNITDYGIASRNGAHVKVENCHYENVLLPLTTNKFADSSSSNGDKAGGFICETGTLFTGSCGANEIVQTGCDYWNATTLPYTSIPDDVATVKELVRLHAGFGNNPEVSVRTPQTRTFSCRSHYRQTRVILSNANTPIESGTFFDLRGRILTYASISAKNSCTGICIVRQKTFAPGSTP